MVRVRPCKAQPEDEKQRGKGHELIITMCINSDTGKVDEVEFSFMNFGTYATIPISVYRKIETDLKEKNTVNLFDSKYCISGEFVFLYPPGIPLVVPGEVITEELLEQIKVYLEANMNISGLKDNSNKTIEVVK